MFSAVADWLLRALRVPGEPHDPEGQALLVFRADEGYYRYRVVVFWIGRVLVLLACAYVGFLAVLIATSVLSDRKSKKIFDVDPGTLQTVVVITGAILAVIYLTQSVIAWASVRLDYELRWYKVTDRSLRIREGVWFVREMTMSFANIQNIAVSRGPIQKLFGVSNLMVQSAGGGGGEQGKSLHVGYFRGIAEAEKVRDLILERLRKHRDTGLGDPDDAAATLDDALRDVRDEARALRVAAEQLPSQGR
jgi:uncharacterized membrane protein YdbT with pleckstrin-like domain